MVVHMHILAHHHRGAGWLWRRLFCGLLLLALVASLTACADGGGNADISDVQTTDTGPDTSTTGNNPPELDRIGNRKAVVGETLRVLVTAYDPDHDTLSYSVFGDLPDGSKFSKETYTFEWAPTAADVGRLVILTFAVSDGRDDDRETIQIEVLATAASTAPQLVPIGDVFARVGELLELRLQGTDEDGDTLIYSAEGTLPDGASLEAKSGLLRWTPTPAQDGQEYPVAFVVSDGKESDRQGARLIVAEPELSLGAIPPRQVVLGQSLQLTVPITNPQNLALSCELFSAAPSGATFDASACVLAYAPTDASLAGTSQEFVFRVQATSSVRTYDLYRSATVSVLDDTAPPGCQPDVHEPNNAPSSAAPLGAGRHDGLTICEDQDWYVVDVAGDAPLRVEILFVHKSGGDLDLAIFADGPATGTPLAVGDSSSDNEIALLTAPTPGRYLIRVSEFSGGSNSYVMNIDLGATSCTNDSFEPNDSLSQAASLGGGDSLFVSDGVICPGDDDWFSFASTAGNQLEITLAFDNATGDLDLELYDAQDVLVGASRLTADEEHIGLATTTAGTYKVAILGFQNASAPYLLEIAQGTGSCTPDSYEPNDTPETAKALPAVPFDLRGQLSACGDADYYALTLAADQSATITMSWTDAAATAALSLLDPGAIMVLESGTQTAPGHGRSITFAGDSTGRSYILEILNASVGLAYDLSVETSSASTCDALSCPEVTVCDDAGSCVDDFCFTDSACPSSYRCRQTYCVDPCFSDSDCRTPLGYGCRVLDPSDAFAFCAPSGAGTTGDSCGNLEDCGPTLACLDNARFPRGMCALIGCSSESDCDLDSTCVDVAGTPICLPFCLSNTDCRASDGYSCQALTAVGASGTIEVCIQ